MCSFLLVNQLIGNLAFVNFYLRPRGPDVTTHTRLEGFDFVHNLLHMTGERTPQPFLGGKTAALFNGEIYNWRELERRHSGPRAARPYASDGEAILPAYATHGERFPQLLDGEYAIAVLDMGRGIATLATDLFGTKPLWYALLTKERRLGVATYKSALTRLGFGDAVRLVGPNRILTVDLASFRVASERAVFEFDLRQFKPGTGDFIAAFERAVAKRTADLQPTGRPLFVGLSSGFDSGAIHAVLHRQATRHHAFVLLGEETPQLLHDRARWARGSSEVSVVVLADGDFAAEYRWLAARAEPCGYIATNYTGVGSVLNDQASVGLSYIVRLSRDRGALCYLSGSGADETLSDYGFNGKKWNPQSSFGGLFPEDLGALFPWQEFFLSTQRDYLFKEEHVAGAHGVEARYPFLDPQVVQEFLWLAPEVKNREYKAPLHDAFVRWGYPFERRTKKGFSALANNIEDERSVLWRYHPHAPAVCGPPPPVPGAVVWCGADGACAPRCAGNATPAADTLRCGLHGKWVGQLVCDRGAARLLQAPSLWDGAGPNPPVVVDREIA